MLANWTDHGRQAAMDGRKRLDETRKLLADMGGHVQAIYLTMGQYDLVGVFDEPDDAIAACFTPMLGQLGNVRTTTMKAFPEEAYRHIVSSLH
ncbi:MAG: GYD domain-containing protein [Rhodopila sp.]